MQTFEQMWDKLTQQQREELLQKIDSHSTIGDKAGIAAMSGASALAVLSTTTYFAGFAFYSTMSVAVSSVAGYLGVTLPFAAYTSASSVTAILSGPVGWAIAAVLAVGGVGLAGRANPLETLAFVSQLHILKAQALQAAGVNEPTVFH